MKAGRATLSMIPAILAASGYDAQAIAIAAAIIVILATDRGQVAGYRF